MIGREVARDRGLGCRHGLDLRCRDHEGIEHDCELLSRSLIAVERRTHFAEGLTGRIVKGQIDCIETRILTGFVLVRTGARVLDRFAADDNWTEDQLRGSTGSAGDDRLVVAACNRMVVERVGVGAVELGELFLVDR